MFYKFIVALSSDERNPEEIQAWTFIFMECWILVFPSRHVWFLPHRPLFYRHHMQDIWNTAREARSVWVDLDIFVLVWAVHCQSMYMSLSLTQSFIYLVQPNESGNKLLVLSHNNVIANGRLMSSCKAQLCVCKNCAHRVEQCLFTSNFTSCVITS